MATIYELYRSGHRVERVQPVPGDYDDTRIGVAVLERRTSDARDGWYEAGEWATAEATRSAAEAAAAASAARRQAEQVGGAPRRPKTTTPDTAEES